METITFKKHLNGLTRVDMEEYFDEAEVFNLLQWIDRIPLSRPRKHIGKDFADGVLLAEIVHHYFPRMVDIHNYTPASHMKQKIDNWYLLNRKVLRKLDLDLSDEVIRAMANEKKKVTEKVLLLLRFQIDKYLEKQGRSRREIDGDYVHTSSPGLEKPGNISPRSERNNEQALVPYNSIKKGRSSPFKLSSPRKYERGEIPHNHPDRSSYIIDDKVPVYDRPLYVLPTFDSVPRMLYEEREMEVMNKDETIKILNSKIRKLEHLLELKEIRIDDLQSQLAQVQGMFFVTKRSSIKR